MYNRAMPAPLDLRQRDNPPAAETAPEPDLPHPPASSVLTWEALEYQAQPKTTLWYALFGIVQALLLFVAFLMRSFLTGIVFALLGVLVLLYSERSPKTARFQITGDSLVINHRRYPLKELDAFNVVESAEGPLALIRSRRLVLPLLHIPLADQDPAAVHRILGSHLKEDPELRESLADLLAHRLGF